MKKDKSKIDKFGMTKMEHFKEYMYMYGWAVIALVVVFGVLWDMGLFKNEAVIEEPYIPEEIQAAPPNQKSVLQHLPCAAALSHHFWLL